jgi:arylsulfatase A-like enzyme
MLSSFVILCGVVAVAGSESYSLFDLSVDPSESDDLYSTDSSNEYHSTISKLQAGIDKWNALNAEPEVPVSFSKHAFAACGGVCPWVETTTEMAVETKVIYENEAAPNVVFVMMSDWGFNDVGFRSNYMNWATPNIDLLASEGISLTNYFTHSSSLPSRGAFLTGRYPLRLGLWGSDSDDAELPTDEVTLATEMQSAGYKTYMVGKWGTGMSTSMHTPLQRGFNFFYGQLSSNTDPYTKKYSSSYLDLYSGDVLVTDEDELSEDLHAAQLYEMKAEEFVSYHAENYPDDPMFMFYSPPLLQSLKSDIPAQYVSRCSVPDTVFDDDAATQLQYYCAMNVMLDEVIGNLTCTLQTTGMANNTLVVLTSDNGGDMAIRGNNYPFSGGKDVNSRGGLSVTAILHGTMLKDSKLAGKSYAGQVHVTDWLPTLMGVATNADWSGSYGGDDVDMDGVDVWSAMVNNEDSPRSEILHFTDGIDSASIQIDMVKLDMNPVSAKVHKPDYIFTEDANPDFVNSGMTCEIPSLMYPQGEPDFSKYFRLYDLISDPYESNNVYKDDDYTDTLAYLQSYGESWQTMLKDPEVPDTSEQLETWTTTCDNVVCAWDSDTDYSPLKQTDPHKNSFKPHIMFVVVDNWGYNDMGAHSSYLSWTTPNIDRLASESITLTNYFTHSTSLPSRAAILTGRYPARTGFWDESNNAESTPELPLDETTLAQEMKDLGYMTYMVGKWGLGVSTPYHWPSERGFDFFYGQLTDNVDPYTKQTADGVLDRHNCTYGECDVMKNTDTSEHAVFEYAAQFEEYFLWHSKYHSRQPMFMYYSLPMMQYPYSAPDYYLARCATPTVDDASLSDEELQALQNYCASSVMLDEVITNMTCTIKSATTRNNTVIVITSSNGALPIQAGSNWPYKGYSGDGSSARGAVSVNALIHGSDTVILPSSKGLVYEGQMHAVDWYPTLLTFGSGQQWTESFTGAEIDGVNMWNTIMYNSDSKRVDMVHSVSATSFSVQSNMVKYDSRTTYLGTDEVDEPAFIFEEDMNYRLGVSEVCYKPSLLYSFTDPNDIYYLYNLNTDPHETESIADTDTDTLSSLWERCDYWNTQVQDPSIPAATGKTSMFTTCGGICPWLPSDSSESTAVSTAQIYDYEDAPHIIFVLVDDWGWNDVGWRSTYMGWTTPNIDRIAAEGVKFNNYFSHFSCMPSRGAFLTGRYAMRLGLWQAHENAELPLSETTIAQEMKSAGYRTALVGKWHQGYSSPDHLPMNRGFDIFYGYLNGYVDYWTKSYGTHLDLHNGYDLETDAALLDPSVHNAFVLQSKVEQLIADHATNHADQPLFLYYAMQLIHGVWAAPEEYLQRCSFPSSSSVEDDYVRDVEYKYCAMNIMLDEAIANLTCTLESFDMVDNTVMVVVSDNGGEQTVSGNSYPFRGGKGSHFRGGISTTGFIHSALIPDSMKGQSYDGQFHITGKYI